METQSIRFYYGGKVHQVANQPTTRTLLQYLRDELHCTGTKEGCAEGDCGACTVMVGELDGHGGVDLRAINACIQFLPALDGKAVFTVEDLRLPDGSLHPVQQALVDCHGSQCGFCTPGFAMSMWGMYVNRDPALPGPDRAEINDALSGNLCRCTGYRPIIDAAVAMFDWPYVPFDRKGLVKTLESLQRSDVFTYEADYHVFHAPRTLAQLAQLRATYPDARILAGSTDIGLWVTKQLRDLPHLIYVGQVAELRDISSDGKALTIGAGALLTTAFAALLEHFNELDELCRRFASLPIRNAGTLGGNVANGSPIGDSMPALIALGTQVVLRHTDRVREMPLEDFYLAYQKTALEPGEFVQALRVPLPVENQRFRTYKLSKRFDQDISAVCAAFSVMLDGDVVSSARIAFGGVAATPKRAINAEQSLVGKVWDETTAQQVMQAFEQDYAPLGDMRATSAYRKMAVRNLSYRFYLETRPHAPLAPQQTSVFAETADA